MGDYRKPALPFFHGVRYSASDEQHRLRARKSARFDRGRRRFRAELHAEVDSIIRIPSRGIRIGTRVSEFHLAEVTASLILDVRMPDMDGLELQRQLVDRRSLPPSFL